MPLHQDYIKVPPSYHKHSISGTGYLAFKYLPALIDRYTPHKKSTPLQALDFGCGTGRSSYFLRGLGLKVVGVDHDYDLLRLATLDSHGCLFCVNDSTKLPFQDNTFSFIFSIFVFMKIGDLNLLHKICLELKRVLKRDGVFMLIVPSEALYSYDWLSIDTHFDENKMLTSGNIAKINIKDINEVIKNYFWTRQDYITTAQKAGFSLQEIITPYGDETEGYNWVSEKKHSPCDIYIFIK